MLNQDANQIESRSSKRFWKEGQRKTNKGFKNKFKTVSSALLHLGKERDRFNKNMSTFVGILQATSSQKQDNYKFQLLTENALLYLEAPKELINLLERHTWERFIIKGTLSGSSVVRVKTARLENEDVPVIYDFSKNFDLTFYKRLIEHGFSLEPRLEEVA